jgi:hypothetical protein
MLYETQCCQIFSVVSAQRNGRVPQGRLSRDEGEGEGEGWFQ